MRLFLSNPAGLWALLAIPVIFLIHFLQEKSRRVRVSTLFLLERVQPESRAGARIERLRNSAQLWWQCLAALLFAWLLSAPRWIKEDSRQTVVVVMDSSASMAAFKEQTQTMLSQKLAAWRKSAAHTDWHLLESNPRKPALYAGDQLPELLATLEKWRPTMGTHRPDGVLATARALVKKHGLVIFVTDCDMEVPPDVGLLSAAEVISNAGFAGVEVGLTNEKNAAASGMKWRTLVKNWGADSVQREWWIEDGNWPKEEVTRHPIQLQPGQTLILSGELPPSMDRATLVLTSDQFTWDDRVPLQKPSPKTLLVDVRMGGSSGDLLRKMIGTLEHVKLSSGGSTGTASVTPSAGLTITEIGTAVDGDAILLAGGVENERQLDAAWTVAEDHPLTRELNWMGLLTPPPVDLVVTEGDEPLLWKGARPLALLRNRMGEAGLKSKQLLLGWNLPASTAARDPAMLVLLFRFVEQIRQNQKMPWAGNFETSQKLEVAGAATRRAGGESVPNDGRVMAEPGHFELLDQGGGELVRGAAAFADTRESDFAEAKSLDTVETRQTAAALQQSEADPYSALWLILAMACLVASWAWRNGKKAVQPQRTLRSAVVR